MIEGDEGDNQEDDEAGRAEWDLPLAKAVIFELRGVSEADNHALAQAAKDFLLEVLLPRYRANGQSITAEELVSLAETWKAQHPNLGQFGLVEQVDNIILQLQISLKAQKAASPVGLWTSEQEKLYQDLDQISDLIDEFFDDDFEQMRKT